LVGGGGVFLWGGQNLGVWEADSEGESFGGETVDLPEPQPQVKRRYHEKKKQSSPGE